MHKTVDSLVGFLDTSSSCLWCDGVQLYLNLTKSYFSLIWVGKLGVAPFSCDYSIMFSTKSNRYQPW